MESKSVEIIKAAVEKVFEDCDLISSFDTDYINRIADEYGVGSWILSPLVKEIAETYLTNKDIDKRNIVYQKDDFKQYFNNTVDESIDLFLRLMDDGK